MESLKVLVVDDEIGMRLGVERVLRKCKITLPDFEETVGFSIDLAETGEEALKKIAIDKPDIMILDHKMPGLQGLDVLAEITTKKLGLLTIMVTAYASLDVAISATRNGAFDFLAKPFTPEEIKNTIKKAANHIILQRKARKLAEEKRQVRFQFISVLAHELKSPIAAVEGYLRIMDKKMGGDNIADYDTMIKRSRIRLEGMQKMILDLLDLTKIESGKKSRELNPVNLRDVAKDAIESVAPDASARGIEIFLNANDKINMVADRGELEIIFNNFMTNAVKYNQDNGRVDVTLKKEKGKVVLVFSDTGIGISKEEQERLFGEFVRIKNEKTKNILGSGLGLSIVKKLLLYYQGKVLINSIPEKGTTFTVELKELIPERKRDN